MATRTPGRPSAPPASANGARTRPAASGPGGLGTAKRSTPMALVGVASVVLGVNWKFVVADVFNSGTRIKEALVLAILLPTLLFLVARSAVGFARWRVQRELWRRDVQGITPAG